MKILELFAGSRSFGKVAESKGFEVFSVDWTAYEDIDLQIDIEKLKASDVPFIPDVVWASPDCATYSIVAAGKHRFPDTKPKTEYAEKCDSVNMNVLKLIKYWQKENKNLLYFIENPRGILRKMSFMQHLERFSVWYCKYGDSRAKPTDIWTNSLKWIPRPMCRNYKYNKQTGEIIDKHCHHKSARRGARTGTQGQKNSYQRSIIPEQLCQEILDSIKKTS